MPARIYIITIQIKHQKKNYFFHVVRYSNEKYYCKQIPCKRILLKNENKTVRNCYHLEYKKDKAKVYYKKQRYTTRICKESLQKISEEKK